MSTPTNQSLARFTPKRWRKLLPGLASARVTVRKAWAKGLRRDPLIKPSEWAERYRVVAEGTSAHPGKWQNTRTPFLVEVMDRMSPADPAKRITLMKSVQVSGSEGISNILGWIIDVAPGPTLVVHPTIEAGRDWTVEKFEPTIEATPRIARRVRAIVIRGRDGSTLKRKQFPGGSIVVTGGNSAAGLRQKSVRYVILDDVDEFPLAVGGQGDPVEMARARKTSFEKSGQDKELDCSTPTNKATSRVWKQYEAGTQARWHVPCPHCGLEQVLEFGGKDVEWGLKFNSEAPHRAHYVCRSGNGCVIEHWQLEGMNARGRWIHDMPFPGREPSYHINSLVSPFTTWDHIVAKWVDAQGDPEKLKTFINLQLGEPWDDAGDRPKAEELMARRETWDAGTVPPGVLLMTLSADVQGDGIWYEFSGWGRDRQTWSLEHGFLAGDTGTATGTAFRAFDVLMRKKFRDEHGNDRGADAIGIDANYETETVVEFCKTRLNCYPLRGEDGWKQPLWTGKATPRTYSERGKVRRKGSKTFPVGTWSAKRRFYGALSVKATEDAGIAVYPPSYCHFSQDWTEDDFRQLLSEVFATQRNRKTGKVTQGWHQVEADNHLLDCRVYGLALAEKLGMSTKSPAEWEWLERKWPRLAQEQRSLFDLPALPDVSPSASDLLPAPRPVVPAATPSPSIRTPVVINL